MGTPNLGQPEEIPDPVPEPTSDDRDPVEALADEFTTRRRNGETPSLDEYVARCPDRAEEIRALFPAIAAMERWKPRPSPPPRRLGGGSIRERIGEYRLIREIGRGGMGIVYEAEQASLGRKVAIKILPALGWADNRPMERFLREARTTASLQHPNIVPVFAVGHEEELHYYVMPLIRGAGLDKVVLEFRERKIASIDGADAFDDDVLGVARTILDRSAAETSIVPVGPSTRSGLEARPGPTPIGSPQGSLPRSDQGQKGSGRRHWQGIAAIGRQVAEALQHAHEAGILHRDIKPANLILDTEGVVWVADFGLAKAMSHDDLSRTGDLVGTLRYMAPERFKGQCDARSDVYSLGLTLYELMTLRPAFDVPDRAELIRKIAEAAPARPRELDPSIPLDLETVVLKALDPDPGRRYASAGELAEDLSRFVDGRPVMARRAAPPERLVRWIGRNRALATLAFTSIVLGVFFLFFFGLFLLAPPHPPRGFPPPPPRKDRPPPPRPGWPPPPRWGQPPPPRPWPD
jgi:eukaryotic-like serine/threonine-protein kinase